MRFLSSLFSMLFTGSSGYAVLKESLESNADSPFTKSLARMADICKEAGPYIAAPDRLSRSVGEVITFREPKYVRLLKEAQEVLGVSEASDEFDAINQLRLKNRSLRDRITELKQKRLLAPKDSTLPFATTQASISKDIDSLENEIVDNNVQIDELKSKILEIFNANKLAIKGKELEYFLISAEGDDLLTLMTIATNMKNLQELIEKELATDSSNVQLAKSYTGMYLVSLDAYDNAHTAAIGNIKNYRQKLDGIFSEAENNYREGLKLKVQAGSANQTHIDSNLALNKKTLEIVQLYDSLLERRIENLRESQVAVGQKVKIARNTYKTLDNGSMLINLVADANNEYSLLVNFEMPELKGIYDTGMLTAFMDITERIKSGA